MGLSPRQLCNVVYALRMEKLQSQDEVDEWLWELTAPLDPLEQAEHVGQAVARTMG